MWSRAAGKDGKGIKRESLTDDAGDEGRRRRGDV
jgi:hypothetical protein